MVKQLNKILKMQAALDKSIMAANGITYDDISEEQYFFAILDEVGEFVHERKKEWCWWKKTQKEVDEHKSLEEMVDILHFVLSYCNKIESNVQIDEFKFKKVKKDLDVILGNEFNLEYLKTFSISMFLSTLECGTRYFVYNNSKITAIDMLILFSKVFETHGYTIDDMYNAYIEKNKVNYERIEKGY